MRATFTLRTPIYRAAERLCDAGGWSYARSCSDGRRSVGVYPSGLHKGRVPMSISDRCVPEIGEDNRSPRTPHTSYAMKMLALPSPRLR